MNIVNAYPGYQIYLNLDNLGLFLTTYMSITVNYYIAYNIMNSKKNILPRHLEHLGPFRLGNLRSDLIEKDNNRTNINKDDNNENDNKH